MKIFDTLDLVGVTLSNRIVMAPMTRSRATADNIPGEFTAEYYAQRSTAGLIITEATAVSKQGAGYVNIPGLWNDTQVAAWKNITSAVHAKNGKIFAQIFHTGRVAHSSIIGEQPVSSIDRAPGATAVLHSKDDKNTAQVMGSDYKMHPYESPRILSIDEMPEIVTQFKHAAHMAVLAGFDGVEIHAANGYILDQFLRDGSNKRTDNYGGSVENRARLLMEVIEATLDVCPKVGVRLSPYSVSNDMKDTNPVETFSKTAEMISTLPITYIHMVEPRSTPRSITKLIRAIYNGPIILNCGLDKIAGEEMLQSGIADLVSYGMPFISNPDLVRRFRENLPLAQADKDRLYKGGKKGYIDYPMAK